MIDMVGFGVGAGGGGAFPLAANLQGSWNLFGGDTAQTDQSGNGNDLSPNNAPGQATGGGPDGVDCADLEASAGQRYAIDDASQTGLSPGAGAFACSIFYQPEAMAGHQFIMGKYKNSSSGEYYLFYDFNADAFKFIVRDTVGGGVVVTHGAEPQTGIFQALAAYIDPSQQEIGLAVNNAGFVTAAFTDDVVASTAPFTIGERAFTGNDHVDGRVAIAHVWDAVPSAAQWTELYNGGNGLRYTP